MLRDANIESLADDARTCTLRNVDAASTCGMRRNERDRVFTLNGELRPRIPINPGERQFWRIVNASPDRYADLQVDGQQLEIVALDGMPLNYHDRSRRTRKVDHVLLPPAGRVEAIVTGPAKGNQARLITQCIDAGPDGDDTAAMVIADLVSESHPVSSSQKVSASTSAPVYREFSRSQLDELAASTPDFTVVFTEDKGGFYINGKKFEMTAAPMLKVRVGSLQHWRVVNATRERHPFHIHQVHFLAYAMNGVQSNSPEWLGTTDVPLSGTVDLIMDFTDPVIRGMSVFHCHLLSHEDKRMMAKILFE